MSISLNFLMCKKEALPPTAQDSKMGTAGHLAVH
jgi:hypothetical protein